jgi:acyl-CoA reductase-like NAD-dependent aldehyde dehydrogenase
MAIENETVRTPSVAALPHVRAHVGDWHAIDPDCCNELRNPADVREPVAVAASLGPEAVVEALELAAAAAPAWARTSPIQRGAVLARAADVMASRGDEIATAMTREMGKVIAESRLEVQRSVETLRHFSEAPKLLHGQTFPLAGTHESAFTVRVPLGVVALITPWNFPLAIPTWKTAAALAYGNAVVLKPAELAPWSASALVECLLDAGLPPDVVAFVPGPGATLGPALVDSTVVAGISFTGSTPVGREIARRAANGAKPVQCELGGRNAIVVLRDASLDEAVAAIVNAGFGTTGQRCTSSSRVIAERAVADELTGRLVRAASQLRVGPGLDPSSAVGPLASRRQLDGVLGDLERARADGTQVLFGGERLPQGDRWAHGHFMVPTVTRGPAGTWFAGHEVFGPVVSVFEAEDYDDAVRINNAVDYGLSSSIYTRSLEHAMRFVRESDTGMVHVNRPPVGAEPHIPFGGAKDSSIGPKEMGGAHEFFTKSRSAHVRWA